MRGATTWRLAARLNRSISEGRAGNANRTEVGTQIHRAAEHLTGRRQFTALSPSIAGMRWAAPDCALTSLLLVREPGRFRSAEACGRNHPAFALCPDVVYGRRVWRDGAIPVLRKPWGSRTGRSRPSRAA